MNLPRPDAWHCGVGFLRAPGVGWSPHAQTEPSHPPLGTPRVPPRDMCTSGWAVAEPKGNGDVTQGAPDTTAQADGDNGTWSALGGDNLGDDSERVWGNPSFQALLGRGRPLAKRQIRVSSYNNNPMQISKSWNQITTKKRTNTKSIEFQSHF